MNKENKIRGFFCDWIIPLVLAFTIAFLINKFIIFKVKIPSESMYPTLKIDDQLFAKRVYNTENLKRGDLVVFYFEAKDKLYIKRLIGLPNDEIAIENGQVSVNGEILNEDYIENQLEFDGNYIVPEGEYFFLGDNRAKSSDSRYWDYPYIESKDIKGKAFIKVYPFKEFGVTY